MNHPAQTLEAGNHDAVFARGVESLVRRVQAMIGEAGDPRGFDAAKWVDEWINIPVPALGGKTPASLMHTVEGQELVSTLLMQGQYGVYV